VSCRAGLNGPTTRPDRVELNGSCRARPTSCRPGPSTTRLVLQAGPGPLPIVSGHARAGPNHAGRGLAHLPRAKFSGLATPTLVLKHHIAFTSGKLLSGVCITKWYEGGGIYRVPRSVPPTWERRFRGDGRPGGHHVAGQPCLVEKLPW
jgi:hypothetical protein